jgi:hypothetical protein
MYIVWEGVANNTCMLYVLNCVGGLSHGDFHLIVCMRIAIHIKCCIMLVGIYHHEEA